MNYLNDTVATPTALELSVESHRLYAEILDAGVGLENLARDIEDIGNLVDFISVSGAESLLPVESTLKGKAMLKSVGIENVLSGIRLQDASVYNKFCLDHATEGLMDKIKEIWAKVVEFCKKVVAWFKYHFLGKTAWKESTEDKLDKVEEAINDVHYIDSKSIIVLSSFKKTIYTEFPKIVGVIYNTLDTGLNSYMQALADLRTKKIPHGQVMEFAYDLSDTGNEFFHSNMVLIRQQLGIPKRDDESLTVGPYSSGNWDADFFKCDKYFADWDKDHSLADLGFNKVEDLKEAVAGVKDGLGQTDKFGRLVDKITKFNNEFQNTASKFFHDNSFTAYEFGLTDKGLIVKHMVSYVKSILKGTTRMSMVPAKLSTKLTNSLSSCLMRAA